MGRISAHCAEIVRASNDALTKMILPKAIHQDTRSQWMVGTGKPFGECRAATSGPWIACRRRYLRLAGTKERKIARGHFLSRFLVVSTAKYAGPWRFAVTICHCHRGGQWRRFQRVVFGQICRL